MKATDTSLDGSGKKSTAAPADEGATKTSTSGSTSATTYKMAQAMRSGNPKEIFDSLSPDQQKALVDFIASMPAAAVVGPPAVPTSKDLELATEKMKVMVLDAGDPMIDSFIDKIKIQAIKGSTSEPDMPGSPYRGDMKCLSRADCFLCNALS